MKLSLFRSEVELTSWLIYNKGKLSLGHALFKSVKSTHTNHFSSLFLIKNNIGQPLWVEHLHNKLILPEFVNFYHAYFATVWLVISFHFFITLPYQFLIDPRNAFHGVRKISLLCCRKLVKSSVSCSNSLAFILTLQFGFSRLSITSSVSRLPIFQLNFQFQSTNLGP